MGKCVSKQQPLGNFGGNSTSYIAISERSDELSLNEGQSESKRNAKRGTTTAETKGTAMSFGFKKKFSGNSNKKNSNNINNKEKEKEKDRIEREDKYRINSATVISNPGINRTDNILSDNNGNTGSIDSLNENEISGRSTPRLLPPKKDACGVPYRQNRFGFRQANTVRPASVGLTPKIAENDCVINNNVTDKPRSKSASGMTNLSRNVTPIGIQQQNQQTQQQQHQQQNPKINTTVPLNQQQQQQDRQKFYSEMQSCAMSNNQYINKTTNNQYTVVNTGIHTNSIVKPTPKQPGDSVSKFTLHTTSLPKPQYPVPVSISLPPRNVMDTKVAKQALNSSRRGFQGPRFNHINIQKNFMDFKNRLHRDISSDSGIASFDSYGCERMDGSPRKSSRNRPRNLEMVMNGRNCFAVRDLDDSLSDDTIVPLVLPKLPSAFNSSSQQTAPLNGLIRSDIQNSMDDSSSDLMRKSSIESSSDVGSIEEEKAYRDKSMSEKSLKMASLNEYASNSKNSSPASSRASWGNAGDTMAMKECSSLSFSSSDESKADTQVQQDSYDDDISSVTITTGQPFSSITLSAPQSFNKYEDAVTTKSVFLTIEDTKFAQMAAAAASDILLDDETSPTDSLVSSCTDTDELISKKNKKKFNDSIKEKEIIDDISPEIDLTSPLSPGTPTHASNSFSLSDGGRDFLIDDEIADQPALLFDDGNDMPNTSELANSSLHLQSITDTPTLMETGSEMRSSSLPPKPKSKILTNSQMSNNNGSSIHQSKPKNALITRTESLDTLSPCSSIASDDLMMDFECHSSMDSIDRVPRSNGSGSGSALHSMDETQLWSELEAQGGDIAREWSSLLRSQRQSSRDSITSQLPARATRLLNRSRLQQTPSTGSVAGSDSPRSLDSIPRRTPLCKTNLFKEQSPEDMVLVDKSLRNSMLQDVVHFKKQLVRLRRLLQEDEEDLKRTETLNPFEHGQFFASCGIDLKQGTIEDRDSGSLTPSLSDDPRQELVDLRRQVVFLQSQMDDKDRTIRMQQNVIAKLEEEHEKNQSVSVFVGNNNQTDTVSTATQTERLRPVSMGQEGIARSEQQQQQQQQQKMRNSTINGGGGVGGSGGVIQQNNNIKRQTQIPTTTTTITSPTSIIISPTIKPSPINLINKINASKTVRTTQVGNVITTKKSDKNPLAIENGINNNNNLNNLNNNNNGDAVNKINSGVLNGITSLQRKIITNNNNNNNNHNINNTNTNLLINNNNNNNKNINNKIPTLVKTQHYNKTILKQQDDKLILNNSL